MPELMEATLLRKDWGSVFRNCGQENLGGGRQLSGLGALGETKQREELVRVNRIRFVKWDDGFAQGNKMKELGTYAVELCCTIARCARRVDGKNSSQQRTARNQYTSAK